jgi:hypothetical protein
MDRCQQFTLIRKRGATKSSLKVKLSSSSTSLPFGFWTHTSFHTKPLGRQSSITTSGLPISVVQDIEETTRTGSLVICRLRVWEVFLTVQSPKGTLAE